TRGSLHFHFFSSLTYFVGGHLSSLRANRLGLRANGLGLRENGLGLRANGLGLRANRGLLRANGLGLRANREPCAFTQELAPTSFFGAFDGCLYTQDNLKSIKRTSGMKKMASSPKRMMKPFFMR
ncbi:hypothetical protein A374_15382, partial [Fictibacillus macauensis ZFHKF-1]